MCAARTFYFTKHRPEHRKPNGVPSGQLPHVYGSRVRVGNGEWSTPTCSWCGRRADQ